MEGEAPQVSIQNVLHIISDAHEGRSVLIVLDQFEDVIPVLGTSRTHGLFCALSDAHNAPLRNLHVLVCYRGDAEPKVGRFWQEISGSASGLPRFYLGPHSDPLLRLGRGALLARFSTPVMKQLMTNSSNP